MLFTFIILIANNKYFTTISYIDYIIAMCSYACMVHVLRMHIYSYQLEFHACECNLVAEWVDTTYM